MESTINITNEQAGAIIENLFHNSPFFMINKRLFNYFDKNWAVIALLTEFLDKEGMFIQKDIIQKKGDPFYHLEKYIEESIGLSPHMQRICLDILKEKQIISIERKGIPARNYYSINHKELVRIFSIVEKTKPLICRYLAARHLNNENAVAEGKPTDSEGKPTDVDIKQLNIYYNKNENINIDTNTFLFNKLKRKEGFSPSEKNPIQPVEEIPSQSKGRLNRRILTKAGKLRSLSIIKRYQEVPVKEIRVSPIIRDLLEHWLELKLYLPKEHTKLFMEGVSKLKKLLSGTLFGQQFNADQIKASMDRFALAALDPDFEPSKPAYKKILAKMSPSAFIENLYSVGEKSFFLKYTKEEPQASRDIEHLLADKYPTMTKNLINLYREKVLSNSKIKFNAKEENCFIRTSQMIHKFFKDNSSQINHYSMPSDSEKVQYLWEALLADVGEGSANIRKITPGWFCSDATFHHRYPAYLTQQGVLYFEEDTDSLSSLSSRQEDIDPFGLYD